MAPDEFDYMAIGYEMRIADEERLREIGKALSRETTLSDAVKEQLRDLYGRLMQKHQKPRRR